MAARESAQVAQCCADLHGVTDDKGFLLSQMTVFCIQYTDQSSVLCRLSSGK